MMVECTAALDQRAYRGLLVTLAIFRLRLVAPIVAFFTFGALAAGRTDQALFLGLSLIGMAVIIWLWASWQAHSPANQSVYEEVTYRFDEDGIAYSGDAGIGEIPWHALKRWRFMSGHYLLHISSGTFLAIPASAVAEADKAPLEKLLAEGIRKGPRGTAR